MQLTCALAVMVCMCAATFGLIPVPQGFPDAWNGDSFVRSPGEIVQEVPRWLDGYLFCQLCASYGDQSNPKGEKVTHMFDAIGGMAQIEITPDYTTYTGAYYPSRPYKIWNFYGRDFAKSSVPWISSFSTYNVTALELWNHIKTDDIQFAPNVDFWKVGQSIIGGTETYSLGLTFDVETTTNFRPFPFKEVNVTLLGQPLIPIHMPVHERIDPDTNIIYSTVMALNITATPMSFHQVAFTVDQNGARTVEAIHDFAPVDPSLCKDNLYTGDKKNLPRYMHSISSTEHYVVLPMTSSVLNPCSIFRKGPPYPPNVTLYDPLAGVDWFFGYEKTQPFTFLLYDKKEKKFLPPIEAPTHQWVAHQCNAYESTNNTLVVDMITYDDEAYKTINVDNLTHPVDVPGLQGHPLRFHIDLDTATVTNNTYLPTDPVMMEFPQFNHKYEGKKYKYTYAVLSPYYNNNSIVKIDMDDPSGKSNKYFKPHGEVSLAEPVFVARPDATEEDDGVLIMRALDPNINKTRVYIVDTKTMQHVGELLEPVVTPFGFHERFYSKESLGIKASTTTAAPKTTTTEHGGKGGGRMNSLSVYATFMLVITTLLLR